MSGNVRFTEQELFREPHVNVFIMSFNLKVLAAEGGVETFTLSINYC